MFKKILHEPLVHFLLLGALVFFIYTAMNGTQTSDDKTIVISKAEQKQLSYRWQKKYMRQPTEDEMQQMIDKEIYTEVLYREALKMGLDQNDLIIRRRLAQKLEFVSSDLFSFIEPSDEVLRTYMKQHEKMFRKAGKISFQQIYVDVSKHDKNLKERLSRIKSALDANESIQALGDAFMLPRENRALSEYEIRRTFGKKFAESLNAFKTGVWEGPIKSGYGLHFVYVEKREAGELPSFDEIKAQVKNAWMSEKKEQNSQNFYKSLKKNYSIEIAK